MFYKSVIFPIVPNFHFHIWGVFYTRPPYEVTNCSYYKSQRRFIWWMGLADKHQLLIIVSSSRDEKRKYEWRWRKRPMDFCLVKTAVRICWKFWGKLLISWNLFDNPGKLIQKAFCDGNLHKLSILCSLCLIEGCFGKNKQKKFALCTETEEMKN